jgi:hypothetical protein
MQIEWKNPSRYMEEKLTILMAMISKVSICVAAGIDEKMIRRNKPKIKNRYEKE